MLFFCKYGTPCYSNLHSDKIYTVVLGLAPVNSAFIVVVFLIRLIHVNLADLIG